MFGKIFTKNKITENIKTNESVVDINGKIIDSAISDPTLKYNTFNIRSTSVRNQMLPNEIRFMKSEYDLNTLSNAVSIDGILRRASNIYTEQILKNSYEIISKDDKMQNYVRKRMKEIQNLTGISNHDVMRNIAWQLVTFGNAYILKVRGNKSQFAKSYKIGNKKLNPINGLFVLDAPSIEVGLDQDDQIVKYKQLIRGVYRYWDADDIIHLSYNKTPGTLTGFSNFLTILDDVRALRKLEEEVEILGFQYAVPLWLYKVGNKDIPASPGEVDQVTSTINNMPTYGVLVVPGHHTMESVSNNQTPVQVLEFIDHFKHRIYAGLGISPIAMGDASSSNRNTAQSLDLSMQTITISYQNIIKNGLEMQLFRELAYDGGFNLIDEDILMNFPEIDIEAQIKKQNHLMGLYQGNIISLTEARLGMNYDANIDEKDFFINNITIPTAEVHSTSNMNNDVSKTANEKMVINKNKPVNQHGSSTRPKIKKDSLMNEIDRLNIILEDGINTMIMDSYYEKLTNSIEKELYDFFIYTINELINDLGQDSISIDFESIYKDIIDIFKISLKDKINRMEKSPSISLVISDIKDYIDMIFDKSYSACLILVSNKFDKNIVLNNNLCDIHIQDELVDSNFYNLPPFKHGCNCYLEYKNI